MELRIDQEFESKIPPLTEEEFKQLEENILEEGIVYSPIIAWKGFIVDGHNRYRVIQKHPDIRYSTLEKEFDNKIQAIIWICKNQLGRRNLTEPQKKYLLGKRYEAEKMLHGYNGESQSRDYNGQFHRSSQNGNSGGSGRTAKQLAQETHTSRNTILRAHEYSRGVDAADEVVPGIKKEILSEGIKPSEKEVMAIAKAPLEERKGMAEALRKPKEVRKQERKQEQKKNEQVYNPTLASINKLSEEMASRDDRVRPPIDTIFIITELTDALESMMFRWESCLEEYGKQMMANDCRKQIRGLTREGIDFMKNYKGGKE